MPSQHQTYPASLPSSDDPQSISVLSYNVLLPNSEDGWWVFKMYDPALIQENPDIATWPYRQDLLKERIRMVNADVVCLQETSADSFESDFAFMAELGYDGVALYRKGRFRPATFWKTSRCNLATPDVHKDRSLITAFRCTGQADMDPWFVVNLHLQAGKQGPRRFRQMQEAIKGSLTLAKKLKVKDPNKNIHLIVCGDMNGGAECGAIRYLEDGVLHPDFQEDCEPVTSSQKDLPLSNPMVDAVSSASRPLGSQTPPTMVVAELMSTMMEVASYEGSPLSKNMIDRVDRIFERLASRTDGQMSRDDVEKWVVAIDHKLGRGDAFRHAAKEMGWIDPNPEDPWEIQKTRVQLPPDGVLTKEMFRMFYQMELDRGKFWAISYDMAVLGEPLPDAGLFTARYDRMYCTSAVSPYAVIDFVAKKPCPNDVEPSDHLPVAVLFNPNP